MDKYIKQQVILTATNPEIDLGVLPYLGTTQITVAPCTKEGIQVADNTVTGTVEIQAYPFGNSNPSAGNMKTFNAATATTQIATGYLEGLTAKIKTQGTAAAFLISIINV